MSIPKEELLNYMEYVIKNKINGLIGIAYRHPDVLCKAEHKYIMQLRDQVEKYHYNCSMKESVLLYSKIPFVLKTVCFFSLAITSLKYRCKL